MYRAVVLLKKPYIVDDGLEIEGEVLSPYSNEVKAATVWIPDSIADKSIVLREDDGNIYLIPTENIAAVNILPDMQKGSD